MALLVVAPCPIRFVWACLRSCFAQYGGPSFSRAISRSRTDASRQNDCRTDRLPLPPPSLAHALPGTHQPYYTVDQIVPPYVIGWAGIAAYALFMRANKRWSVTLLSAASSLTMVFCSCCFLLAGITRSDAVTSAAGAAVTYGNDKPAPFIAGIFVLLLVGGSTTSVYPLWETFVWVPFVVPAIYLIAHAISPQPEGRYTQARG